jgi:hypothetical protein
MRQNDTIRPMLPHETAPFHAVVLDRIQDFTIRARILIFSVFRKKCKRFYFILFSTPF